MDDIKNEAETTLSRIQLEIRELVDEAKDIIEEHADDFTYQRANSYWIPHIIMALSSDHGYLGGSMVTMEDTLREMFSDDEDEENEND